MSNMSYCRFQNTYGDLVECVDALEQERKLSNGEYRAAMRMFTLFLRFCRDVDIIDGYDRERLEEYLGGLREGRD